MPEFEVNMKYGFIVSIFDDFYRDCYVNRFYRDCKLTPSIPARGSAMA
jgi:hypothetical protein